MINEKNNYRGKVLGGLVVLLMSLGLIGATFEKAPAAEQPTHAEKKAVVQQAAAANGEGGTQPAAFATAEELAIEQFVEGVATSVDAYWYEQITASGVEYPAPFLHFVYDQPIESPCGTIADTDGPAYCSADTTVYYPVNYVNPNGQYIDEISDFAVAFAIAHEMAHHVQNQLGILEAVDSGKLYSIQSELQADCLAGVWANSAYYEGLVAEGDIDEILSLLEMWGDPEEMPAGDPYAHGTAEERMDMFMLGYDTGDVSQCGL